MDQATVQDLWDFMKENKKWWLLPIVIALIIASFVIIVWVSNPLSPYIYAMF